MCDRRVIALIGVFTLVATPVDAQQAAPRDTAAVLEARRDSLIALYRQIEQRIDRREEAARRRRLAEAARLDTQHVGVVTIVASPAAAPAAGPTVAAALERYGELAHDPASPLAKLTLLVEDDRLEVFDDLRRRPGHVRVWLPAGRGDRWRERTVRRGVERFLADALPDSVRAWTEGRPVGFAIDDRDLAHAYRSLAASSSTAARDCLAGSLDGCRTALGLADPGPRWERWYPPEALRRWARANRPGYSGTQSFDACFDRGDVGACARVRESGRTPPAPLDRRARGSLLALALDRGGPAGFERLRDASGSTAERIGRAGGVPFDTLLTDWRGRVLEARREASAGLGGSWLATLFWTAAIAALAMRSSRWRLG